MKSQPSSCSSSSSRSLDFELPRGQDNQLGPALLGGLQKSAVIGVMLDVPEHQRQAFQTARTAVENGEPAGFEILHDFAFECVQIQVHVNASALSQHQNIRGTGQVAGGRRHNGLRPNHNLAPLFEGPRARPLRTQNPPAWAPAGPSGTVPAPVPRARSRGTPAPVSRIRPGGRRPRGAPESGPPLPRPHWPPPTASPPASPRIRRRARLARTSARQLPEAGPATAIPREAR